MTKEEAINFFEKYLRCLTEPCPVPVTGCHKCELRTTNSEQMEVFKFMLSVLKAQADSNTYDQGRIDGRVEMRTEILEALKNLVASEAWNNI